VIPDSEGDSDTEKSELENTTQAPRVYNSSRKSAVKNDDKDNGQYPSSTPGKYRSDWILTIIKS
jgi:hypothetical protein